MPLAFISARIFAGSDLLALGAKSLTEEFGAACHGKGCDQQGRLGEFGKHWQYGRLLFQAAGSVQAGQNRLRRHRKPVNLEI